METGFRRTQTGELIPRDIITQLVCTYNGVEVFRAELHPAMAANPLLAFTTVATESGTLEFRWTGDNGYTATQSASDQGRLKVFRSRLFFFSESLAADIPLADRALRLRVHEPRDARDAGRRGHQPRGSSRCSTAKRCGSASAPGCRPGPATSMKGVAARYPAKVAGRGSSTSSSRSTSAAPSARRRPLWPTRARSSSRSPLTWRASRAACRSPSQSMKQSDLLEAGERSSSAGRAAQPRPAPSAMTTTGEAASPARHSRRRIRPAIRSTGWNGRAWAR